MVYTTTTILSEQACQWVQNVYRKILPYTFLFGVLERKRRSMGILMFIMFLQENPGIFALCRFCSTPIVANQIFFHFFHSILLYDLLQYPKSDQQLL